MANSLYNYIVGNLRQSRLANTMPKMYTFGSIYAGPYANWKHDPNPLIFCMYSNPKYTHGLNIHYLNYSDKAWFARVILMMVKGKQVMDGFTFYKMLKLQRMSIVRKCYRVYFTNMAHYKLVGQGLNTYLYNLVYDHKDPWVKALNEATSPSGTAFPPVSISYHAEELRDRINSSLNATSLSQARVSSVAPWSQPAPYIK